MTLTFDVYDRADLTTPVGTLNRLVSFDGHVIANDTPDSKLIVQNDTPDLCTRGRIVTVTVDGTPGYSFIVKKRSRRKIGKSADQLKTTIVGPDIGAITAEAEVFPTLGFGKKPWAHTRTFSFASPQYTPDGAWIVPTVIVPTVIDTSYGYTGKPDGFWGLGEPWIGPSSGDDSQAPFGYNYLLYDFTLDDDTLVAFGMAADDRALVFLDGFILANIDPNTDPASGYATTTKRTVLLSAGAHRVGVKLINDLGDVDPGFGEGSTVAGNPTAFVMTAWAAEPQGKLTGRLFGTADYADWLILEYPDTAPGMTITQIAGVILTENQDAGYVPELAATFTDTADTDSNAMDQLEAVTVGNFDKLRKLLGDWYAAGYCEWSVGNPGGSSLPFNLWKFGERGGASAAVYENTGDIATTNLASLDEESADLAADVFGVEWAGGPPILVGTGTRLGYLQTDAATLAEATARGTQAVAVGAAKAMHVIAVDPIGADDVPLRDFPVADSVTVVDPDDGDLVLRVNEIGLTAGQNRTSWALAVGDVLVADEERVRRMLEQRAGGSNGLTASGPIGDLPRFGRQQTGGSVPWNPSPVATGESLEDTVPQSGNLYALKVVASPGSVTTATDTTFELNISEDGGVSFTDILVDPDTGSAGILEAGTMEKLIPIPDPVPGGLYATYWVTGGKTRQKFNLTAFDSAITGLTFTPMYLS